MHVILSTDRSEFSDRIKRIHSWDWGVLPYEDTDTPLFSKARESSCDLWLGSSADKSEWTLSVIPWFSVSEEERLEDNTLKSACSAVLVDPPKPEKATILKILLLIQWELEKTPRVSEQKIQGIFNTVRFSEYRPAQTYLSTLPEDWLQLPVGLYVDFTLSEGACVYPEIFRKFRRDSLKEVLEVLFAPRWDGLLVSYSLAARDVIPLLAWNVDWPLLRRGKDQPHRRGKIQGALPWEYHPDQTLLTLYQCLNSGWRMDPPYFGKPVVRLSVGGRTREEAVANWYQCARTLRKLKRA